MDDRRSTPLTSPARARRRLRPLHGVVAVVLAMVLGFGAVWTNVLGAGDRLDVLMMRVSSALRLTPDRDTLETVVITPRPSVAPTATPSPVPPAASAPAAATPTPAPVRAPVDVAIVDDHAAVFASQVTDKWCAVAGTQMVLAILGLGDNSEAFQAEIAGRIGEWEAWDDSHNGGWGPAAVALALAAYGEPDYELRAYDTYADALHDSAVAISTFEKPVVMFPWWGAHTWVMTGYRADADPLVFPDAQVTGAYILDPWYPRTSSIWGPSDGPGNFEDLGELERNWPAYQGPPGYESIGPGWTRPEGLYPDRDGRFVVLLPTTPRD